MSAIRKRIAAVATVLALGGLGGIAWSSNPAAHQGAVPAVASQSPNSRSSPVSTGTSGAVVSPAVNVQPFPGSTVVGARRDD